MSGYRIVSPATSNNKTKKMLAELNIDGVILYLAPSNTSGFVNLCPYASPGCAFACLYTAGHGMKTTVQEARIRRTKIFAMNRAMFLDYIVTDLETLLRRTKKSGKTPVARLNGTSDLQYEDMPVTRNGIEYPNIFAAFPEVTFYDYTKVITRLPRVKHIPNYHVTFSLSESNDRHAQAALDQGFNVAAVIKDPGATWGGIPVIDGDTNDFRFLDPKGGHIVALKAKGKARKDTSGFVRSADDALDVTRKPVFGKAITLTVAA